MQVDCHPFVMSQRKQEYNDILHTLMVIRAVDEKTPKSQVFLTMWLMKKGELTFDLNMVSQDSLSFNAIVKCLMHFFDDDTDIYWIARKFYDKVVNMKTDIPRLIEATHNLFEKEDTELYRSLMQNSIMESLPLATWFDCCFAGIINENCIIK